MDGTVITKKGIRLLSKVIAGRNELNITRAAVGTGRILKGYDPSGMIGLIEYRMDAVISGCSADGDTAEITMQVSSEGIETGFIITEIGVFAEDPDDGEILYAYIDLSDDAQYIYPEGGDAIKFVEITLDIIIAEGTKVTAFINPSSMVKRQEFEAHIKDPNPHKMSPDKLGLGNVDNTSDMDKPVSTAQQTAMDDLYEQMTAYTKQKIADLINGAPDDLDTLKEVSDALKAHRTVMDALNAAIGKKANAAEFDSHTKDTTKHITAAERTGWNAKMEPTGDSANQTIAFSSGDAASPTGWADINVVTSGEKHSSLWRKMSLAVKNMRYLYRLIGSTDISAVGGGTLTGAVNALNTGLGGKASAAHTHTEYFPKSGGTVDGKVNAGGKVQIWTDDEGGNVHITGGDGTDWEIDAYNGALRIFNFLNGATTGIAIGQSGKVHFPNGAADIDWDWIINKPSAYTPASHRHAWSELTNMPDIGGSVKTYAGYIGYHNTIYGHAFSMGIGNGIYIIRVQGSQIAAGSDSTFDWGLNLSGLLNVLKLPANAAYHTGTWLAWNSAGQLITGCVGMGPTLTEKMVNNNRILRPGRYYTAGGGYGGWDSTSSIGQNGTVWNAEIVVGE